MNYEKIKSGALFVLVFISLAFTWAIWNYQPSYETINDGVDDAVTEVEIGRKEKLSSLLKPSKLISHLEAGPYGTVNEADLDWVMKEMKKWTFYEPENISGSLSDAQFNELLTADEHVELVFSSSVPLKTMRTMISFSDTNVPNAVFNRMVITEAGTNNKAFVYFISFEERLVFKSEVETSAFSTFKSRYMERSARTKPYVAHEVSEGPLLYVPETPPDLKIKYYRPDQIEPDTFKHALFTDPGIVSRGARADKEVYTDGSSYMWITSSNGFLRYVNLAEETIRTIALNDLIVNSIDFINDHSGWVDDYRLFEAEPGSSNISYRLFLGNYPVFDTENLTEISQTWGQSSIYKYQRSSLVIQLGDRPISESDLAVPLQSGEEAIDAVLSQGNLNPALLENLWVGYEMTFDQSANLLMLKPYWFYEYNGSWQKLITEEGDG